jgi:hypothetical protein
MGRLSPEIPVDNHGRIALFVLSVAAPHRSDQCGQRTTHTVLANHREQVNIRDKARAQLP